MWVVSPCTSTRLSSSVTVRKVVIGLLPQVSFPTLQLRCREVKQTKDIPNKTLHSAASHRKRLISNPAISSHTVWMCRQPNPRLRLDSAQRSLLSVRLLRKCTITILNHLYCPRLASYLVGKMHLQKSIFVDHIKAQMVKADFIKCPLMSARCKNSHVCTEENCTCSTASMRKLRIKLSEWTSCTVLTCFTSTLQVFLHWRSISVPDRKLLWN